MDVKVQPAIERSRSKTRQ